MKKILAFLLAFMVFCGGISTARAALNTKTTNQNSDPTDKKNADNFAHEGNIEYCYIINRDGTLNIQGIGARTPSKDYGSIFTIPRTLNGRKVTAITGGEVYGSSNQEASVFERKCTDGKNYYYQWPNNSVQGWKVIGKIIIPDSVTEIGDYAFYGCDQVQYQIPDSVKKIGAYAFYCYEWQTTDLTQDQITWKNITDIGSYAFGNNQDIKTLNHLDRLVSLGDCAFMGCTSLRSIKLPDGITEIGSNPFRNCQALTSIQIAPNHPRFAYSEGVLFGKNDKRLISYLPRLAARQYMIPDGIQVIGNYAFADCKNLENVYIPETVNTIGDRAFSGSGITSLAIPESVKQIGEYAFPSDCILMVYTNSYAHQYAAEHDCAFVLVDNESDMSWL